MSTSPRSTSTDSGLYGLMSFVAFFTGMSQALVPLLARGLFDRRPALSIAARWSAPWWWIGCAAFGVAAFSALVAIDNARRRAVAGREAAS